MHVETERDGAVARLVTGRLSVATRGQGFTDLTDAVSEWIGRIGAGDGLLAAVTTHTTATLVVQENADADVRRDLLDAFERLAPVRTDYRHGEEGPDDMPGHIKGMLTDVSVVLPVAAGALQVGRWQALYLVEHRHAPHTRTVRLSYVGS
jgi:secondary thiamine-phosphate synthase enzyme